MIAITTRRVSEGIAEKAKVYLHQAAQVMPEIQNKFGRDTFFHNLHYSGGADDGLGLDALINVTENKISILKIFRLERSVKSGRFEAANVEGEKGKNAKLLSEKYLDKFLNDLEAIDIGNFKDRTFTLTPNLAEQIVSEIDKSVNYPHISDTDISKYERPEIIEMGKESLIILMKQLKQDNYFIDYNKFTHCFEAIMPSFNQSTISIPLGDVLRTKWETGNGFMETLYECAEKQLREQLDEQSLDE